MTYDLVITGGSSKFTREQLIKAAESVGWKVRSSFCSKTNLVIAAQSSVDAGTRKVTKAREKNVAVYTIEWLEWQLKNALEMLFA